MWPCHYSDTAKASTAALSLWAWPSAALGGAVTEGVSKLASGAEPRAKNRAPAKGTVPDSTHKAPGSLHTTQVGQAFGWHPLKRLYVLGVLRH